MVVIVEQLLLKSTTICLSLVLVMEGVPTLMIPGQGNRLTAESVCSVHTAPVPAPAPGLITCHILRSATDTLVTTSTYDITSENYLKLIDEQQNPLDILDKLGQVFRAVNCFKSTLTSDKICEVKEMRVAPSSQ